MTFPKTWGVGEHVMIIGDTGSGKTTLEAGTLAHPGLLSMRDYVMTFRTKADPIVFPGFKKILSVDKLKWPFAPKLGEAARFFIEPNAFKGAKPDMGLQRDEAVKMIERAWVDATKKKIPWCINIDEEYYLEEILKMKSYANMVSTQGRSLGITFVTGAQRLSWVTKFILGGSTHIFIFRQMKEDRLNWKKALDTDLGNALGEVKGHDFIYYHRPSGEMIMGDLQSLPNILTK